MLFRIHDVGGQKSDRRKWLNLFDCVHAVAFCVSLTSYEQVYVKHNEDSHSQQNGGRGYSGTRPGHEEVNQLRESLRLFATIVNSKIFIDAAMILFLSKTDLFLVSHEKYSYPKFRRNRLKCYKETDLLFYFPFLSRKN